MTGMSDEHDKADWHMTEGTVPERPYNGPLGPKIALGFVILFVVGVLLIWLFPLLVLMSDHYRPHP